MSVKLKLEASRRPARGWRQVVSTALAVLLIGFLLALAANALSPRGLSLTRDYFPEFTTAPQTTATNTPITTTNLPGTNMAALNAATNVVRATTNSVAARLQARGLQLIEHDDVVAMLKDPRTAQERFVFVDARNDKLYQEGHVPGAVQLDYYHLDPYLATALAACQVAEKVVIYCNGGDCEDSELTAVLLGKAVPREKLFVYPGGFTQWLATGQPVELGARRSGVLKGGKL